MAAREINFDAFIAWVAKFNRKFTAEDVTRQPRLFQAAVAYVAQWDNNSAHYANEFMLSVKRQHLSGQFITPAQAKGILNVARVEAKREEAERIEWQYQESLQEQAAERAMGAWGDGFRPERLEAPDGPAGYEAYDRQYNAEPVYDRIIDRCAAQDSPASRSGAPLPAMFIDEDIPNATYTVVFDSATDDRITLKISDPKWLDEASTGKQQVSYLFGPENTTDYKGVGFITNGELRFWKRFAESGNGALAAKIERAITIIARGDKGAMMEEYALRSSRCAACGRELTVPASIHRGLGPECAKRFAA